MTLWGYEFNSFFVRLERELQFFICIAVPQQRLKDVFLFALQSVCTNFASRSYLALTLLRQVRLRLDNENKNCIFLFIVLALH